MENAVTPVVPLTVGDVWARVRRRPRLLLVPIALGLLAGVGHALLAAPTYSSSASVVVQPLISDQFAGVNIANVINMATEAQVAQSSQVAALAAKRLKVPAGEVQSGLSIATPQGTQVIELHYSAGNQQAATDGAQVVAESYLAYREGAAGADVDRQLAAIQKEIDDANAKLAAHPNSQVAYQDSLRSLLADQRTLTAVKSTAGGRIISAASWPGTPTAPRPLVDLPIGLVGGALVGLALALLWPSGTRHRSGGAFGALGAGTRAPAGLDELIAGAGRAGDDEADDEQSDDDVPDGDAATVPAVRPPGGGVGRPGKGQVGNGRPGRGRFDKARFDKGRPRGASPAGGSGSGGPGSGGSGAGYLVGGGVPVSGSSGSGSGSGSNSSGSNSSGSTSSGSNGAGAYGTGPGGAPRAVRTTAQSTGRPSQPVAPASAPQTRPAPGPVGRASASVTPPGPTPPARASVWQPPTSTTTGGVDTRRPDMPELDRLTRQAGATATLSSAQLVPPQASSPEPLTPLSATPTPAPAPARPVIPEARSASETAPATAKPATAKPATAKPAAGAAAAKAQAAAEAEATAAEGATDDDPPESSAGENLPWFRR